MSRGVCFCFCCLRFGEFGGGCELFGSSWCLAVVLAVTITALMIHVWGVAQRVEHERILDGELAVDVAGLVSGCERTEIHDRQRT